MKLTILLSSALVVAALPSIASATDIATFTSTLTATSPLQLGRISRNAVPQTWTGAEPTFPGEINTTTPYSYMTYTFAASLFTGAPYVEISDFDTLNTTSFFVSAYSGSYNPLNKALNWLGDEGSSGNFFGTDARFFDVILPINQSLVLVVNNSVTGAFNDPHLIDVSAYADTSYDDPTPVVTTTTPEPSTFVFLGTGLLGVAGAARRRLCA